MLRIERVGERRVNRAKERSRYRHGGEREREEKENRMGISKKEIEKLKARVSDGEEKMPRQREQFIYQETCG